jgi:hypothetical protein
VVELVKRLLTNEKEKHEKLRSGRDLDKMSTIEFAELAESSGKIKAYKEILFQLNEEY